MFWSMAPVDPSLRPISVKDQAWDEVVLDPWDRFICQLNTSKWALPMLIPRWVLPQHLASKIPRSPEILVALNLLIWGVVYYATIGSKS